MTPVSRQPRGRRSPLRLIPALLFWAGIAVVAAPFAISYFYIDLYGVEIPGRVYQKQETVRVQYSDWSRRATLTVQYAPPDSRAPRFFGTDLDDASYDALHVGQAVTVHYLRERDLPSVPLAQPLGQMGLLPVARLAGRTAWSPLQRLRQGPVGRVLEWLVAAAILLIVWRIARWPFFGWAMGVSVLVCFGLLLYSGIPKPTLAPAAGVRRTTAKVASLSEIDYMFRGNRSRGIPLDQPIRVVGLEFIPGGWKEPVVAVDLVDADSVAFKEGALVQIDYQESSPRTARLVSATRTFPQRNLNGIVVWAGLGIAALVALLLIVGLIGKLAGNFRDRMLDNIRSRSGHH